MHLSLASQGSTWPEIVFPWFVVTAPPEQSPCAIQSQQFGSSHLSPFSLFRDTSQGIPRYSHQIDEQYLNLESAPKSLILGVIVF